jgi:predicted nucleic acid-binding protein
LNIIRTQDAHRDALRLARRLGLRSTYDAHYLALADDLDCEFWTADERLYNAVRERFPLIRWLGAA